MTNAHLEACSSEGSGQRCPEQQDTEPQDIIREAKDKVSIC